METNRRPSCSVFSNQEISEIKRIPVLLKFLIAVFVAILAGIFVPFQTVSELSKNVGALLAVQEERQKSYLRDRAADEKRAEKTKTKLYWIEKKSEEARDAVNELKTALSENSGQTNYPFYGRLKPKDIPSPP